MLEADYKAALVEAMKYFQWEVQQHEDKVSNFIPDLSFAVAGQDGWAEVKYCKKPPKSLNSIDHWTRGQQEWLFRRGARGGDNCYLIVGTPDLSVAWSSKVLHVVREEPWELAVRHTPYREKSVFELVSALNYRMVGKQQVAGLSGTP